MSAIEVRSLRTARARNVNPRLGAIADALTAMRSRGVPQGARVLIETTADNETLDITAEWEETHDVAPALDVVR